MKTMLRAMIGGAALLALAGCSGGGGESTAAKVAGAKGVAAGACYVGDVPALGGQMEFKFAGDGTAVMTMIENGNRAVSLDCTYQAGETQTALSCPGSSGITMTPTDSGDMEGNLDGTIVLFKKC